MTRTIARAKNADTLFPVHPSYGADGWRVSGRHSFDLVCSDGSRPVIRRRAYDPELCLVTDGPRPSKSSYDAASNVLQTLFDVLSMYPLVLEAMILMPPTVLSVPIASAHQSVDEAADAAVQSLLDSVPPSVAEIASSSDGRSDALALARLSVINVRFKTSLPWVATVSFGGSVQNAILERWRGGSVRAHAARQTLHHRAACTRAARRREYGPEMEKMQARQ